MIPGIVANADVSAGGGGTPSSPMAFLSSFNGVNDSQEVRDESSNGLAVTLLGNAKISTAQAKFGTTSLYLDGTGDGMTLQYHDALALKRAGAFTIDYWVYPTGLANYRALMGDAGSNTASWALVSFGNGAIEVFTYNGSGLTQTLSATGVLTNNAWHHLAVDWDGNDFRVYVNGVMVVKHAGAVLRDHGWAPRFGINEDNSRSFLGYIDELRIVSGVAEYASDAGFVPPVIPYERPAPADMSPVADPYWANVLYLQGDDQTDGSEYVLDDSAIDRQIIYKRGPATYERSDQYGAPADLGYVEFGGSAVFPLTADLTFGTTPFTLEGWVWLTTGSIKALISVGDGTSNRRWHLGTASDRPEFIVGNSLNISSTGSDKANLIPTQCWVHLAADRDAAGVFRVYINGRMVGKNDVNTTLNLTAPVNPLSIGGALGSYPLGKMRDARITKGVARYQTDTYFSVPAKPFSRNEGAAPSFSVEASITSSGFAAVGDVLTVNDGTHTGRWVHRQWRRNGTAISGATDRTYTLAVADIGATIDCLVTARNFRGSATSTAPATAAVTATKTYDTGALAPSGDMQSGGDRLIPAGDMQSGGDVLLWKERTS